MLVWCIGECMVSIINIKNDIKELTRRYQNCNSSQKLIFGGCLEVRESFYTQANIWVTTILSHIDSRAI